MSLKPVDEEKLVRAYQAGQTMHSLTFFYGIGEPRMREILKRHGVATRKRGWVYKKLQTKGRAYEHKRHTREV